MAEEFTTQDESDYSAPSEQFNTAPINLARMGAYVRTSANSTQTTTNSTWISDLTNNTTNPSFSFAGVVHEVIVFDRRLSEEERQQIYGYLSRKYRLESKMPVSYKKSMYGAYPLGLTYWNIEHHPNSIGISSIPAGICFGGITLSEFVVLPDTIYKSSGTVLSDGTVLSGDTYSSIGL